MALSRSFRRTLGIASIAALLTAGLIAPPAQADLASPSRIDINCLSWTSEKPKTSITGIQGEIFTITNKSASAACNITANGVVSTSPHSNIPTSASTDFKIIKAGTFKIIDSPGNSHEFMVTLRLPPAFEMYFNAKEGSCVPGTTVSGTSYVDGEGDGLIKMSGGPGLSYSLPDDKICTREGYTLKGWGSGSCTNPVLNGNTGPGAVVQLSGSGFMCAVWKPDDEFNEITYDANVDLSDKCFSYLTGVNFASQFSRESNILTRVVTTLLDLPTCYPVMDNGEPFRNVGWNTEADGTGTSYYISNNPSRSFALDEGGQKETLYAMWASPCPTVVLESRQVEPAVTSGALLMGCDLTLADLTGADLSSVNFSGADLTKAELTDATVNGETVLDDAVLTGANLLRLKKVSAAKLDLDVSAERTIFAGANLTGADLTGANLKGAFLNGADLTRADLTGADLTGANLFRADLQKTKLEDAVLVLVSSGRIIGTPENLPARWNIPVYSKVRLGVGRSTKATDLLIKVDEDAASGQADLTVTTTELSAANVATITTSAAHGFVVGQQVSVILTNGVVAYDGNRTVVSVPTTTTFTFDSVSPAIASATVSGTVTGIAKANRYLVGPFANLGSADLSNRSLNNMDLTRANLRRAKLTNADLTDAELGGANLGGANLTDADLTFAFMNKAKLNSADLTDADLRSASLDFADLTDVDLTGAILTNVYSCGITGTPKSLPTKGTLTSAVGRCLIGL